MILGLEVLMVLGWAVTLWSWSDGATNALGRPRGLALWAVGWHVELTVGLSGLTAALLLAAAMWRAAPSDVAPRT